MLEIVGHPHAVNPDKELRKKATASGWPVLVFTKPVALRSRCRPSKPTLAALAVGGAVAVGGIVWAGVTPPTGRLRQRPARRTRHADPSQSEVNP